VPLKPFFCDLWACCTTGLKPGVNEKGLSSKAGATWLTRSYLNHDL